MPASVCGTDQAGGQLSELLADVRDAVAALRSEQLQAVDWAGLLADVTALRRLLDQAEGEWLRRVGEVHARGAADTVGAGSTKAFLRGTVLMSPSEAGRDGGVAPQPPGGLDADQLFDPGHVWQIARQSAKLTDAQARLAQVQETATELSRRLGEGQLPLARYDAAMGPLDERLAKLTAEVATVDERRAMVRRAAPRGIVVRKATAAQHSLNADVSGRLLVL